MELNSQQDFSNVVQLIASAKGHVSRAVNTALIDLYWSVGEYVSKKANPPYMGVKGMKIALVMKSLYHTFVLESTQNPDYQGAYMRLVDGNSEKERWI